MPAFGTQILAAGYHNVQQLTNYANFFGSVAEVRYRQTQVTTTDSLHSLKKYPIRIRGIAIHFPPLQLWFNIRGEANPMTSQRKR